MNEFQELYSEGIIVFDVEDYSSLELFQHSVASSLEVTSLEKAHRILSMDKINELRLKAFHSLNSLPECKNRYYSIAQKKIDLLLGPDLLIQKQSRTS